MPIDVESVREHFPFPGLGRCSAASSACSPRRRTTRWATSPP